MREGETTSPSPGESITCIRSAQDGGAFIFDMTLGPGVSGPPLHTHDECDESIEVLSGEITFVIDGRRQLLKAGDKVTLTPTMVHTFKNESKTTPVVCRCTHGARFERAIAQPSFLQLAMFLSSVDPGASRMHSAAIRAGLRFFALLGRLRGLTPVA